MPRNMAGYGLRSEELQDSTKKFTLDRKLLVVSSWAPPMAGGPQNLYNLFSQFSADSYCILTSYDAIQNSSSFGRWLAGEYFFYDRAGTIEKPQASALPSRGKTPPETGKTWIKRATRLPPIVKRPLSAVYQTAYLLLSIAMIVRMGVRVVRHRKIESIMGVSDTGPALISTYLIARCTGLPYVLYLFDIYLGNKLPPIHDLLARVLEPLMFRNASFVIVTNEGTERFYRKRYAGAVRCAVIHNSVFPKTYEPRNIPYQPKEPYSMVFTGQVYWAQERSLLNFLRAMKDFEVPVHVDLYVPIAPEALKRFVSDCANVRLTAAPQSEMPGVQCGATILFLPLSWHTGRPEVIATATPGKLADYLASGRPILIHAPPYAYVNEYARQEGFALIVDEENIQKLQDSVKKLTVDVQYSRELIENAKRTLRKNHDVAVNARKLANLLDSL